VVGAGRRDGVESHQLGSQLVSIGGVRYWAQSSYGGPEGFGARLIFTLLYPN
jgi:hypothetical protein